MKLNNQVCTLEQAIKLKELGINQESLFYYVQEKTPINPNMVLYGWPQKDIPFIILFSKPNLSTNNLNVEYSAFNESELAIMLDCYYETYISIAHRWKPGGNANSIYMDGFNTPCEASAANLIFLIEHKEYLTANDCNERLNNFLK